MKIFLSVLLCSFALLCQSQGYDTLRIMTYNLLYYGEVTSFCDNSNNNINSKDLYLKTIVKHVDPDLLVVNEMGAAQAYVSRIISKVLNTDGESKYKACAVKNNSFSSLANGMFYNKKRLELVSQKKIAFDLNGNDLVRVIDVNKFYYTDSELVDSSDTAYLYVAAAHLKAGNSNSDEQDRALAAESLMDYFSQIGANNYVLCGDLNLYSDDEDAFQNLISNSNGNVRLYDPINQSGSWNNNSSFSAVHTQSTRSSSTNGGCFSGGGMDDRFDFILMSGQVVQDTGTVSYIEGSYRALGQDGNHFNQAVNDGSNNSVPSVVLGALYEMSDHLPVIADIKVRLLEPAQDTTDTTTGISAAKKPLSTLWVQSDELRIDCHSNNVRFEILDISGRLVYIRESMSGFQTISLSELSSGMFIVKLSTPSQVQTQRIVLPR
jgi:exonuclease III